MTEAAPWSRERPAPAPTDRRGVLLRTVAIVNQKGGSGKTTTAINLAAALAHRGARTLLVDMDPQGHCGLGLAIPEPQADLHIGDALTAPPGRPIDLSRLIWHVARGLDLIPATTKLAALEAPRGGLAEFEDRDSRLAQFLGRVAEVYDWCLVDCSPSIGLLAYNALRAASQVLIPVETAFFALQGASKQVATILALSRRTGTAIPFAILPTLHEPDSQLAVDVLSELQRRFAEHLLPVTIRVDSRLKEAASLGLPAIELDADCPGARDYLALATHLLGPRTASPRARRPRTDEAGETGPFPLSARVQGAGAPVPPTPIEPVLVAAQTSVHVAMPVPRAAPMTRAAELAARARRLAARSAELSRRLDSDPDVARVMKDLDPDRRPVRPEPNDYAERLPSLRRVFGVKITARGVVFVQPGGPGSTIFVAGDHNNWSPTATPMRYNPELGLFEACVRMPQGRHRYRLVVDGRWVTDGYNPLREPNPFGEEDSVVVIETIEQQASATNIA